MAEMQRGQVLSMERLRTAVRRDLEALLNTVHIEQHRVEGEDGEVALLDGFPQAAASVINYGLPPLTGRVRAQEDHEGIAAEIELAVQRFEPRIPRLPGDRAGRGRARSAWRGARSPS